MDETSLRHFGLAQLLEQTARSIYDRRSPQDIHPGQWSALRFFEQGSAPARTVNGLARYLGTTSAPASRAIAALQRKGFIQAAPHPTDRRSQIYSLTDLGQATLTGDPVNRLARAIAQLPSERQEALADALEQLYDTLNAIDPSPSQPADKASRNPA